MGLGTVELVMELEDEFKLPIPDDAAGRMERVGDVFNFILGELRAQSTPSRNDPCPSAKKFRTLRDDLHIEFGVPRRAIRPSAAVAELIPPGPSRAHWGEFARQHNLLGKNRPMT